MTDLLFVYGTLRPGSSRWSVLQDRSRSVRPATARGALYRTAHGYPAARFDRPGTLRGDLVELGGRQAGETLELLDRIEGTARGLFRRVPVEVRADGDTVVAWAYEYGEVLPEACRIPGGDWMAEGPEDR